MNLFNNVKHLERSLDASAQRQRLINNNIANIDTPGYKTMDLSFESIFAEEKNKAANKPSFQGYQTDSRHFSIGKKSTNEQFDIEVDNKSSLLNNGNNVDVDYEMTKLAENNIWYSSMTQAIDKEFSMLRYVITEGRR